MVQIYKIDGLRRTYEREFERSSEHRMSGDYLHTKNKYNERKLKEAMQEVGALKPQGAEMPTWEGPYRTGKALDVGAYLNGKERCMWRKVGVPNGQMLDGKRVICQLALLGDSGIHAVMGRAIASLAVAAKLKEHGDNVSLMFTWASQPKERHIAPGVVWYEASDASISDMARLMDPKFFRSMIFSLRDSRNSHVGFQGFGPLGGSSNTIDDFQKFKSIMKSGGLLRDGDICLDWQYPVKDQISMGLEQIES